MVPYKNGTRCEKIPKGYLRRAELGDFYKEILKFVMRFQNQVFPVCV